jgi:hypothetical protein
MIKQALLDNTAVDAQTGAVPNDTWGYGKMRADDAWNDIPTDAGIGDFAASATDEGVTLTWNVTDDVDCVGFNIYRAASIMERNWKKVNAEMISRDGDGGQFVDTTVPLRHGHYLYVVKTVDASGAERPRASTMIKFAVRDLDTIMRAQLEEIVKAE